MNNLSILLYLADVAKNIGWIFNVLLCLSIVSFLITLFVGWIMLEHGTPSEADWRFWKRWLIGSIAVSFSTALASALIPSKETVYAIAASEMGEEVLNSKIGGKAQRALESWLDSQISDTTDDKENTSE